MGSVWADSPAYTHTPHIASALIDETVYTDAATLDTAIQRTFEVCMQPNIPIHQHFRCIYVHDATGHVHKDRALSDLAFYLLLLNGDMHNPFVAHAYAIRRIFR